MERCEPLHLRAAWGRGVAGMAQHLVCHVASYLISGLAKNLVEYLSVVVVSSLALVGLISSDLILGVIRANV